MVRQVHVFAVAALLMVAGCSLLSPPSITPGESESKVISRLGQPTGRYQDGNTHLLEYRKNPGGQETWMVRFDPAGQALSIEQVLTSSRFQSIEIGKDNKQDVLRKVGAPYQTSWLALSEREVWTYMYKENDVWDSLMHIHFDRGGTVRTLMNAPDLSRRPETSP